MVKDQLDGINVVFDDGRSVADAGVLLVATLARKLGIEALVNDCVDLGRRVGYFQPGRKVLSLIHAMLLGADSIDGCDVLRSGRTGRVLGHRVMAPSTLGTFLRAFTFGHVRQLDRVLGELLARAWRAGAGPGAGRLVIDVDSFIREVHGKQKQGASYGYTKKLGYHPLLATRAGSGEVLHVRFRAGKANTQRGVIRFVDELLARVSRAGATGEVLLRADSGYHNAKLRARLAARGVLYSIGVRQTTAIAAAIALIPEHAWVALVDYPESGEAQIAETKTLAGERLIVRRVRTLGVQAQLFETWRHFGALTNRTEPLALVEAEHRDHATVELDIRDLLDQALAHAPSGEFAANAAWTVLAAIAHNLHRWSELIGLPNTIARRAHTNRRRMLAMPGRLTYHSRRWTLHLPTHWPWQTDWQAALTRIRALPILT